MKKNLLSVLLVIVMIAALMLSVTGCGAKEDTASAERIAQLELENAELQAQIEELTEKLSSMNQKAALKDWTLDAEVWSDSNGATVTFSATPVSYTEGQKAALSVRMGDLEAESTNCVWDGTSFTGSVELSAADGYSYYCILMSADGSQEEIELTSPENPTNEALVYLGTNLNAYANLVVEEWEAAGNALIIKSGYIQVQMPRMAFMDMEAKASKAELVLQMNGEEIGRQEVSLQEGEGQGSYEVTLSGNQFQLKETADDYQLDLFLEVTMTGGNTISVNGGSWYSNGGELMLIVG